MGHSELIGLLKSILGGPEKASPPEVLHFSRPMSLWISEDQLAHEACEHREPVKWDRLPVSMDDIFQRIKVLNHVQCTGMSFLFLNGIAGMRCTNTKHIARFVCVSVCPLLTESYLIQVNPGSFTISDFLIAHCRGTVGSNFLAEWWATSCRFHALSKLFSGSELIVYIVHFRFQHFQTFWNALFAGRNITLVEKRASYGLAVGWFCASPFNIRHVKSSLTPDLTTHKRELCRDHRSLGLLLRGEKNLRHGHD